MQSRLVSWCVSRSLVDPSQPNLGVQWHPLTKSQTHLHSQLAQLSANLADTDNLVRMTSVQAEAMRGLGSWHGGMFMAASKVLGEEAINRDGGPPK